jgi:uncharacterized protein involved in exopolysaccharide biosynthesis/Mrp family chromosome partitioning ATPase
MNRIITIAVRHWKPLLGLNVVVLAIASYAALTAGPKVWTAQADLIVPNTTSELNADLGTLGQISGGDGVVFSQQLNPLKILSSIMTSNEALNSVWQKDPEKELYPRLSQYSTLFEVSPQAESTIISLSANGSSPDLARGRAVAFIEAFQQRLNELRKDDAEKRSQFMEEELEQARLNLLQAQTNLAKFKESSNLVSSENQTQEMVASINILNNTKVQTLAQAQASEAKAKNLATRLDLTPKQAVRSLSLQENKDYQFVRQKLSDVEAALVEIRGRFLDEHPKVQDLLSQRNELRRQLEQYIAQAAANTVGVNTTIGDNSAELIQQLILAEVDALALKQQADQLQNQIDQLNTGLKSLPAKQNQLLELQRQYDTANGVYNGLVAKEQETKLSAFGTYPSVQVLNQPSVDPKPIGPKRKPIALGAILGCVFGSISLALFLESRNPLLSLKDLQAVDLPVIRSIPRFKHLVMELDPKFETAIEFQRLASAISMKTLENRRLMIGSATAGEGKTTVTFGLASALVTLGFRVLIVDGDFRKAELSRRLGYSRSMESFSLGLKPVQVRPGLDLLLIRPDEDKIAEFVARGGFEQSLSVAQAAGDYDYVLIDSAPVSLTSEAALMATVACNVLLVVWLGTSHRNPFNDTLEQLMRHKAQILGLVVNGMETLSEGYLYGRKETQISS